MTSVLLIVFSQDTSYPKALRSTDRRQHSAWHRPVGDLLGELLGFEQL